MTYQTKTSDWASIISADPRMWHIQGLHMHLARLLDMGPDQVPQRELSEMLASALEAVETDGPGVSFLDVKADADLWADIASPRELEAYFVAIMRRMVQVRHFAPKARKRLLVALWETLPPDDRRAFLAKVDPAGKFVRASA